jgi:hypothetical protein
MKIAIIVGFEDYLDEGRRYAEHRYCYGELVDDHAARMESCFDAGISVYEAVDDLGDKYDLDRADTDFGINAGKVFVRNF